MDLRQLFTQIDLDMVKSWVEDSKQENLHIEFKTLNNPRLTSTDDKKNFSKAISGFLNSNGGIIVWGVNARKDENEVDCAESIIEIDSVDTALSRFNECTGEAVSPIASEIEHRVIPTEGERGLIVTLVPESTSGPHMAKLGENRYYKRSGDSFYCMEHFDLEDMFGRRQKPDLILRYFIRQRGVNPKIVIQLENGGRGIAKAPYLEMDLSEPFRVNTWGVDGNGTFGLPRILHGGGSPQYRFGAGIEKVIHPGVTHDVLIVDCAHRTEPPENDLEINYQISAEEQRIFAGELQISVAEMVGH